MNNHEIKKGYKQTDVGIIPEDWECKPLISYLSMPVQNGVFYEPARKGQGCKLINVGDLYLKAPIPSNDLELFDARKDEIKRFGVETGDIFFTRSSITPDGIAHCNIYKKEFTEDVVFDSHIIRIRVNTNKVNPFFLFRYCVSSEARKYLVSNAKTTTMATIDQSVIANLRVVVPPLAEQQAIAEALSDVDVLITSLDRLITKKRNIKQGAMQLLLTGKKRLAGFSGEWETKTLGEIADATAGGTPNTQISSYWNGNIRWMSSGELNLKVVYEVAGRITEIGLKNSSTKIIPPNCILVGLAGQGKTRGTVAINKVELCTNQSIAAIYPSKHYVSEFLYHNLDNRYEELRSLSAGDSGRGGLNLTIIKKMEIKLPPTIEEQKAIAQILSEMDAEIEELEAKRDKYKAIKQGMMQELLTGKTRLI